MIFRILFSASLFALGYYIGKEIGRTEPIRNSLEKARQQTDEASTATERETQSGESGD